MGSEAPIARKLHKRPARRRAELDYPLAEHVYGVGMEGI